jgi:hypothetical protein
VSEPDTVAALAAQVGELRELAGSLKATVTAWDARLEREGVGATLVVRLEIKKLREKVDELAAVLAAALDTGKLKDPPAPRWDGLEPAEEAGQLAALRAWADSFLAVQYPGYRLPACWQAHREALWELGTLHAEWQRVYGDPRGADLAAALWFHERWLPGVLGRLARSIPCDEAGCRAALADRLETTRRYGGLGE